MKYFQKSDIMTVFYNLQGLEWIFINKKALISIN